MSVAAEGNEPYFDANQNMWNEWATIHMRGSETYPIEQFVAGEAGWEPNLPDDVGSVRGKSILHMQCHFGMDTLMRSRQGAVVAGVDFSDAAIQAARELNVERGMNDTFVRSNTYDLPDVLKGEFDIVLTCLVSPAGSPTCVGESRSRRNTSNRVGSSTSRVCTPLSICWRAETSPSPSRVWPTRTSPTVPRNVRGHWHVRGSLCGPSPSRGLRVGAYDGEGHQRRCRLGTAQRVPARVLLHLLQSVRLVPERRCRRNGASSRWLVAACRWDESPAADVLAEGTHGHLTVIWSRLR